MSDQITYMLPGDRVPRRGPAHLKNTKAWKIQGCREIPDIEPVKLQPIEAVAEEVKDEQPEAPRRGRPRKTEADADQA
jgi:hypothetical protein